MLCEKELIHLTKCGIDQKTPSTRFSTIGLGPDFTTNSMRYCLNALDASKAIFTCARTTHSLQKCADFNICVAMQFTRIQS